ncbi:MAG: cytochrome c [Geobacteraceae bacterium]
MNSKSCMSENVALAVLIGILFVSVSGVVAANEGMEHGNMHREEAMAKQHKMMGQYAMAQWKINESLRKRDTKAVEIEAGKMLVTIPVLKAMTPHKNLKDQNALPRIAAAFESDLKTLTAKAKKGDLTGAKAAFSKAEKRCDECHAKFRD